MRAPRGDCWRRRGSSVAESSPGACGASLRSGRAVTRGVVVATAASRTGTLTVQVASTPRISAVTASSCERKFFRIQSRAYGLAAWISAL